MNTYLSVKTYQKLFSSLKNIKNGENLIYFKVQTRKDRS